jgi:hypothetical protein
MTSTALKVAAGLVAAVLGCGTGRLVSEEPKHGDHPDTPGGKDRPRLETVAAGYRHQADRFAMEEEIHHLNANIAELEVGRWEKLADRLHGGLRDGFYVVPYEDVVSSEARAEAARYRVQADNERRLERYAASLKQKYRRASSDPSQSAPPDPAPPVLRPVPPHRFSEQPTEEKLPPRVFKTRRPRNV